MFVGLIFSFIFLIVFFFTYESNENNVTMIMKSYYDLNEFYYNF